MMYSFKRNIRLKAFTITEIIIVMVITTVVAGIAFTVLRVTQKNIGNITENYSYKTNIQHLEQKLTLDFNSYTQLQWDDGKQTLVLRTPIAEKKYQFSSDSIVADQDIFAVKLHEKKLYFQGEEVVSGNIDAVALNFSGTSDQYRIFVFRPTDLTLHF